MMKLRPSIERGSANHGWLDSKFTFSFAHYYDVKHMGFGPLRVINEDFIEAAQGFGMHPHDNMEILTYIIKGSLEHQDSMGHHSVIKEGMIQKMSAGSGIRHSEFNASEMDKTHLLQIWMIPNVHDIKPNYEEYFYDLAEDKLVALASCNPKENEAKIYQDLYLYRGVFNDGKSVGYDLKFDSAWIQLIEGSLSVNDMTMSAGDGLAISSAENINILALKKAHFLLFDMNRE